MESPLAESGSTRDPPPPMRLTCRLTILLQLLVLASCASIEEQPAHICMRMQPTGEELLIETCDGSPATEAPDGRQQYQSVFGEVLSVREGGAERTIGLRLETLLVEANGSVWLDGKLIATAATSVTLVGRPGHELQTGGVGLGDIVDTTGKILEGTAWVTLYMATIVAAAQSGSTIAPPYPASAPGASGH